MSINEFMNNRENTYYGHGTSGANDNAINSIIINGLRCSHGSLYNTSIALGQGGNMGNDQLELLKHWPHNNSKIIVIISLPSAFNICSDGRDIMTNEVENSAFYYIPSINQQDQFDLSNSNYIMPEFI